MGVREIITPSVLSYDIRCVCEYESVHAWVCE